MPRLKTLGLYCFGGGVTLGLRSEFAPVANLEGPDVGLGVARRNLGIPVVEEEEEGWPSWVKQYQGIDLLHGNPPCHAFAGPNTANKGMAHPDLVYTARFIKMVGKLKPVVAAFDMVPPMLTIGRTLVDGMVRTWREIGYATTVVKTDVLHVGVPQMRKRLLVIAHRVRVDVPPVRRAPWATRAHWDAISDLAGAELQYYPQPYPDVPEHPYQDHLREGSDRLTEHDVLTHKHDAMWEVMQRDYRDVLSPRRLPDRVIQEYYREGHPRRTGKPSFLTNMTLPERPSGTITGGPRRVHYFQPRLMTLRELARIMSYPDWWRFGGPDDTAVTQRMHSALGKATPPELTAEYAPWLAEAVRNKRRPETMDYRLVDRIRDERARERGEVA